MQEGQASCRELLWRKADPVPIMEFIESPDFLDQPGVVYPKVVPVLEELAEGDYEEVVLTGAIGAAKSSIAAWITAYELYKLSLYENPQVQFGMDPASEILFIFQSVNGPVARTQYKRFRTMCEKAPYFRTAFRSTPTPRASCCSRTG